MKTHAEINEHLRQASGCVSSPASDKLMALLYEVMRDHIPPGKLEEMVRDIELSPPGDTVEFSNGWLARYAKHLADRLT